MSRRPAARPRVHTRTRPQVTEPAPAAEPPTAEPEVQPPSDDEREPGDWRPSRPASPPQRPDDASEGSEATSRPTRAEPASRYANLNFWKARRVTFYRNGDPFHPGVEFRFKPGRDLASMDALLDRLSERLELPRGARFIFGMDGDRKYRLEELEDGASYVVSSYKTFKVSYFYLLLPVCVTAKTGLCFSRISIYLCIYLIKNPYPRNSSTAGWIFINEVFIGASSRAMVIDKVLFYSEKYVCWYFVAVRILLFFF